MPGALSAGSSVTNLSDLRHTRTRQHCRRTAGGNHLGSALPFNADLSTTMHAGCGSNNTTLLCAVIAYAGINFSRPLVVASTGSESDNTKGLPSAEVKAETDRDPTANNLLESKDKNAPRQKRRAGSSDWIASAVTRRFG